VQHLSTKILQKEKRHHPVWTVASAESFSALCIAAEAQCELGGGGTGDEGGKLIIVMPVRVVVRTV